MVKKQKSKIKPGDKVTPTVKKSILTHIEKRLSDAENKGMSFSELLKVIQDSKDTRDKVLGDMVNKMFDEKSLLMISVLDRELMYFVLRHLIVLNFYAEYWNNLTVEILIEPDLIHYPYYKRTIIYHGDVSEKERNAYKRLIDEVLKIQISYKGQGRNDIKDIIKGLQQQFVNQDMMEQKKQGWLSKFT